MSSNRRLGVNASRLHVVHDAPYLPFDLLDDFSPSLLPLRPQVTALSYCVLRVVPHHDHELRLQAYVASQHPRVGGSFIFRRQDLQIWEARPRSILAMALSVEFVSAYQHPVVRTLTISYAKPPPLDITLEEFETFAIARLRVLSHIESLSHRSLPYAQFSSAVATYLKQHLPLSSNTARNANLDEERRKDEIGHWILRLAFCRRCVESNM